MKKLLLTILSLACSLSMALGVVGCSLGNLGGGDNEGGGESGGDNPPKHTHTYSETYSSDDTYHWLDATCEHTDLVDKKGEHTFDEGVLNVDGDLIVYSCTVCGYAITEEVIYEKPLLGLGGILNIDLTDKNNDDMVTSFIYQFVAGLSEGSFNLDFMGIGNHREGDVAAFIRDGVIYIADNTDQVDVGDLSEIVGELDKFEHTIIDIKSLIEEAFQSTGLSGDSSSAMGIILNTLQNQSIFNLIQSAMVGGYNYIAIDTTANDGNTVTTYDLHKTLDNLLAKIKEVGAYIDANMDSATVKSLYNSEAFKVLAEPLFSEINASDLESVLNSVKDLYELATENEFPIEIFEAGDMTAYDYIAKYLDVEFEIEGETFKVGDLKLNEIIDLPEMEEGVETTFVDFISALELTLDKMLPTCKLSVITEGTSTEMGKVLAVELQTKIVEYYNDNSSNTLEVELTFELNYDEYDEINGFVFNFNSSELYDDPTYADEEEYVREVVLSLLPTETGYEFILSEEENWSSIEFVANFNLYEDEEGNFEKVELIAVAKENGAKTFDLNAYIANGYEEETESDYVEYLEFALEYNSYYEDGELETTTIASSSLAFKYENYLLTQIDFVLDADEEIYGEGGHGMHADLSFKFTYNEEELLTKVVISSALEEELITFDISYLEDSDTVASVKASLPNDFAVLEVKFEYTEDLEIAKVEFIVDFIITGEMGEGGEPVVEPYNGQFKLSVAPIYNDDEELVGIKGEIYLDTRDEKIEATYELTLYFDEPEFVELPEIDGVKLTLEEIMEMLDFNFPGSSNNPGLEDREEYCNHDWDMCYEIIDGDCHLATCWYCDYSVKEEHSWEDFDGDCSCSKCGATQSDFE